MQLIGMLDSPYVRRTFISARLLGVPLEHRSLSVFGNFAEFHAINPLVKAPTLVFDDGEVMVDSSLILETLEELAAPASLLPADLLQRRRCRQITSLAVAMCDKAVQLYYEIGMRPETSRWDEWITRVTGQLVDTATALEQSLGAPASAWTCGPAISQADVSTAVAWRFTNYVVPHVLHREQYPRLGELSHRAEAEEAFKAADFK